LSYLRVIPVVILANYARVCPEVHLMAVRQEANGSKSVTEGGVLSDETPP